jgi:ubiquinone/menaquinone biosynthesis C-methylase UbiE
MKPSASTDFVRDYYDQLAPEYDLNRFGNTYGRYIDAQERTFLKRFLQKGEGNILDAGCGTGRLSNFATHGADISLEMLKIAASKYPDKTFINGSITTMPFEDTFFDLVFSFHVMMHQSANSLTVVLQEMYRLLKPGGYFVFDFPSAHRRNLLRQTSTGWHAATSFRISDIREHINQHWKLVLYKGVAFLPIHRIPVFIRPVLLPVDELLSVSPIRHYASYLIIVLQKQ